MNFFWRQKKKNGKKNAIFHIREKSKRKNQNNHFLSIQAFKRDKGNLCPWRVNKGHGFDSLHVFNFLDCLGLASGWWAFCFLTLYRPLGSCNINLVWFGCLFRPSYSLVYSLKKKKKTQSWSLVLLDFNNKADILLLINQKENKQKLQDIKEIYKQKKAGTSGNKKKLTASFT